MMREIALKRGNFRGVCPTIGRLGISPSPKTVEALMSLDLPAGVEIEIKL